jgi:hypothetical protein
MEILGRERRRRWTKAQKLEILAAVEVKGETLARVPGATMCREVRFITGAISSSRAGCCPRRLDRPFCRSTSARPCWRRSAHAKTGWPRPVLSSCDWPRDGTFASIAASAKVACAASTSSSPKPSRSRSPVARNGASAHAANSVAPFRMKRSRASVRNRR